MELLRFYYIYRAVKQSDFRNHTMNSDALEIFFSPSERAEPKQSENQDATDLQPYSVAVRETLQSRHSDSAQY